MAGEVYALPRLLDVKTKDVRARLGEGDGLSSVDETKAKIGQRMTPAIRRHVEEARGRFRERSAELGAATEGDDAGAPQGAHRLAIRQAQEWERETKERAVRLPKGWRGLWQRLTGRYQEIRTQNETRSRPHPGAAHGRAARLDRDPARSAPRTAIGTSRRARRAGRASFSNFDQDNRPVLPLLARGQGESQARQRERSRGLGLSR